MVTTIGTKTDVQIQRDVLDEIKWDARVQPNEIGVAVKDGIVTLSGWVDSYTKKWAAEEAALRVRGVKAVANEIEVRLPTSAERTDAMTRNSGRSSHRPAASTKSSATIAMPTALAMCAASAACPPPLKTDTRARNSGKLRS